MIREIDRYQGVVLRELIVSAERPITIGLANSTGRVDCFFIGEAAFQVKYSSKRLSPWQFSFTVDQISEVAELATRWRSVWLVLVCGVDGVLGVRDTEFASVTEARPGGVAALRITRTKNSMFRVHGNSAELPFAKPRGLEELLADALGTGHRAA